MGLRGEWLGSRSVRVGLLAVLLAVGTASVLGRGPRWLGSWKLAVDETTGSLFLVGPVAAGVACGVYVRLRRSHVDELLCQAARPWQGWVAPAAGVWAIAAAAVLLLGLGTTTAASVAGSTAYPEVAWVVGPALVVLGGEVACGALVGSRVQHYWAVPWVGLGTFLLFLLTRFDVVPVVFDTGPTAGELIGESFASPWFVFQAIVALGLAAAALAASHSDLFRVSAFPCRLGTGLSVVIALAVLVGVQPPLSRYTAAPLPADVCRDSRPVVCMSPDGHRPLDDLASKMESVARPLVDARVPLPARFVPVESSSARDPGVGMLLFADDEELAREVDDGMVARSLAMPTRCPEYFGDEPPPEQYFAAARFLALWLLVQSGDEDAPTDGAAADWWVAPLTQQLPWVRTTYDALTDCRLRDLRLPTAPVP